jgi:hypothetical protein
LIDNIIVINTIEQTADMINWASGIDMQKSIDKYTNFALPREVYDLVRTTLPVESEQLDEKSPLTAVLKVTQNWCIAREKRLSIIAEDPYLPFNKLVVRAAQAMGLRKTKEPKFKEYSSVVIFGGTGLSHFYVWKDLLFFYNKYSLRFKQIYMLGGDRAINLFFDSLDSAYKLFPDDFKCQLTLEEIAECKHEMQMMELISSAIKLPVALQNIPIIAKIKQKN